MKAKTKNLKRKNLLSKVQLTIGPNTPETRLHRAFMSKNTTSNTCNVILFYSLVN